MQYSPEFDDCSSSGYSQIRTPDGCQVCNATTNIRKNFGVPTCVSCRIFYSRNITKDLKCYQNGHCRIDGPSRKSCAYCRFQKCLSAGMHKTQERRHRIYKRQHYFKSTLSPAQQRIRSFHKQQLVSTNTQQASRELFMGTAEPIIMQSAVQTVHSVHYEMDNSGELFQKCIKLAEMFRKPFVATSPTVLQAAVPDTKTALCILEATMKRVLTVIRKMPHFDEMETNAVSSMISEKICGLTAIMSGLNYNWQQDSICLNLTAADNPAQMIQPLGRFTESVFADLVNDVMTDVELGSLIKSMRRFYQFVDDTFKDLKHIALVLLAGVYFFSPDYKFSTVNTSQLKRWQQTYLTSLRNLVKAWRPKQEDFMVTYTDVMLQFSEIKAIEFYHNMLARNVTIDSSCQVLLD